MSQDFLYKAILGSIVSEKSTRIGEKNNQYVFRVVPEATKEDVKAAVELLFKVKVKGVQMLNLKGKQIHSIWLSISQRGWTARATAPSFSS